jgi:hypothetical protein
MKNIKIKFLMLLIFSFLTVNSYAESVWDNETQALEKPVEIVVYRSPTCGCCGKWLEHLKKHQFNVKDIVTEDMDSVKEKYHVPKNMASCHTAIVDGYVVEGHVPAGDIKAMLNLKPEIIGISVPGMIAGTPGMEMGNRNDPFKVIAFDKSGKYQIFHSYDAY